MNFLSTTFGASLFSGAFSGSIAAAITVPFDVIKTRRQVDLYSYTECTVRESPNYPHKRNGNPKAYEVARQIWRQHGVKGFFTGLPARLAKVPPACAIMISSYEVAKLYFSSDEYLS